MEAKIRIQAALDMQAKQEAADVERKNDTEKRQTEGLAAFEKARVEIIEPTIEELSLAIRAAGNEVDVERNGAAAGDAQAPITSVDIFIRPKRVVGKPIPKEKLASLRFEHMLVPPGIAIQLRTSNTASERPKSEKVMPAALTADKVGELFSELVEKGLPIFI